MFVDTPNSRSNLTTNNVPEYKIVIVGPRKVGKSASVVRFLTKRFISEYVENTDMPCKRVTEVDGEPLRVNIQDTSDKGMRLSSVEHHFRWADAIMLMYSITDEDGFRQLKETATRIMEKTSDLEDKEQSRVPPLVIVGNKGDLDYVRKVSREQGFELAERLRCDFFEASAREGWSKLMTRVEFHCDTSSPTSDNDTVGFFAGTVANVGMVGVQTPKMSPSLPRGRSASRCNDLEDLKNSETGLFNRLASATTVKPTRRHTRSNSTISTGFDYSGRIPDVNVTKAYQRLHSLPSCPELNENNDNTSKSNGLLLPPKNRKFSAHGGFIGRLSPRLARRFSRSAKTEENQGKRAFKDDNNNKSKKQSPNSPAFGFPTTFFPSSRPDEIVLGGKLHNNQLSSSSNSSGCNSNTSSACTSATGSTESLVLCGQDVENKQENINPCIICKDDSALSPLSPPIIIEPCCMETKLQEHEFGSSEPFLHLCRGRSNRERIRSRSPSYKIMSGLKKIRSLASDHSSHSNHHHHRPQQVNNTMLTIPVIKL